MEIAQTQVSESSGVVPSAREYFDVVLALDSDQVGAFPFATVHIRTPWQW